MFTEARARWLHQNYRWLEDNLAPRDAGAPRRLILPTPEFFPMRNTRDHAFASAVFDRTRDYLDMAEWPCRLTAQDDEDRERREALYRGGAVGDGRSQGAAGTFSAGEEIEITYAPDLLSDPTGLVATLAHELAHYLLFDIEGDPPAGWDELEPLTDLTAVVEGFGVFLCNNAFNFGQWNDGQWQGWQWNTRGYLNTAELGFALGIFCVRTSTPAAIVLPHLKSNPRQVFADSFDFISELENAVE
jgi:hypothetical protein